jgi:hypothetical protein
MDCIGNFYTHLDSIMSILILCELNDNAQIKLELQFQKNGKEGYLWMKMDAQNYIYRDPPVLRNNHDNGVVSTWRDIYSILDLRISHAYMDQHDDYSSIQATLQCTTFQFQSYGSGGKGFPAQDMAVVEHFEKDNMSLSHSRIGIVSR